MKKLLLLMVSVALLAGCGVKNDLVKPNGERTPRNANDPSRPPNPIGR
jgi:predicted small lipoprotein YifL